MDRYECDISFTNHLQPGLILSFKASSICDCLNQVFDARNNYMSEDEIESIDNIVIELDKEDKFKKIFKDKEFREMWE